MSYFAKIDNGIVSNVIVDDNAFIADQDGVWIECFEQSEDCCNGTNNTHPRGNMASVGYSYDVLLDAFIPPKPYPSWVFNQEMVRWEAPLPPPEDDMSCTDDMCMCAVWVEDSQSWGRLSRSMPR